MALLAVGCKPSDGTGPIIHTPPPPGVNLQNPAFYSVGVAAFEAAWGFPALRSTTGLSAVVGVAGAAPAYAPQCGAGGAAAPASPLAVFPDSALGRIYAYDLPSGHFLASADTGGPAGGVEFRLPVMDSTGLIVTPLEDAGTLDLFDVTPPSGPLTLHSLVTGASGGTADYLFAVSGRADSNSGILSGRVAGPIGGRVFTFRDSTTGYLAQTTAGAVVTDSGTGGVMKLIATKTQTDPFDYFYDLDFTYQSPGQRVRLLGHNTVYCLIPTIGLTVTVNDSDFAIVTQGASGPVISALSDSLTPAQDSAIRSLIRAQGEVFKWLAALALPAKQFLP
ncbi:MAG TPA: hypothetical protein VH113_13265 [Gemmatimonadales bacterium]|nr:hypothetical protein [Gemmatimonadales bacterium]